MKKILSVILFFILIFALIGCDSNSQNNEDIISNPLICFTAENSDLSKPDIKMSEEQAEFIIKVLNESSWENSISKTEYDFVFHKGSTVVRYCYNAGIFNDVTNNKHVVLSVELKAQVNKTIDQFVFIS